MTLAVRAAEVLSGEPRHCKGGFEGNGVRGLQCHSDGHPAPASAHEPPQHSATLRPVLAVPGAGRGAAVGIARGGGQSRGWSRPTTASTSSDSAVISCPAPSFAGLPEEELCGGMSGYLLVLDTRALMRARSAPSRLAGARVRAVGVYGREAAARREGRARIPAVDAAPGRLKRPCYICYEVMRVPTIPHRELRNNSAEILRRVQAGRLLRSPTMGDLWPCSLPCPRSLSLFSGGAEPSPGLSVWTSLH